MNRVRLRIVKVGGSLLQFAALRPVLKGWLARDVETATVLIAGGGELADWVRAADTRFRLEQTPSHWMAVKTMSVTSQLLAELVPAARFIQSWLEMRACLEARRRGELWVLDPLDFLVAHEPKSPGAPLGTSWAVTSDSIAARLAVAAGADELVLLKSAEPPAGELEALRSAGYVDEAFPRLASRLPEVHFVNLLSSEFTTGH